MNDYLIIYEQGEDGGWGAYSPDVDGVVAVGASRDEVERRMSQAMTAHLVVLREEGHPTPQPRTTAGYLAA
jgi:predicted RNase H-like HicB family nuclease